MLRFVTLSEFAIELQLVRPEAMTDVIAHYRAKGGGAPFEEWAEKAGVLAPADAHWLRQVFEATVFRCIGCAAKVPGAKMLGMQDIRCPQCNGGAFKRPPLTGDASAHSSDGYSPPLILRSQPATNARGMPPATRRKVVLEPGEQLGIWRIVRLADRGGMGTIFQAYSDILATYAAVKMLSPEHVRTPRLVQRFEQEAKLQARLDHPNIVQIKDFGEHKGYAYLVMAWIEGETLAEKIAEEKRLLVPAVIDIGIQVCRGLQEAHANGVIHRDLKPENILIDHVNRGRVKITDFGFAKAIDHDLKLTETGRIVGTPAYMPPEQVWGDVITPASDVYALGATLFHALTGQLPFDAPSFGELLDRHINEAFPSAGDFTPEVPQALDLLLQRMCAKRPQNRPANMAQVADALATIRRDAFLAAPSGFDLPSPSGRYAAIPSDLVVVDSTPAPSTRSDRHTAVTADLRATSPRPSAAVPAAIPSESVHAKATDALAKIIRAGGNELTREASEANVRVIDIHGPLDPTNVAELDGLLAEMVGEGAIFLVLDLSRCTQINASVLTLMAHVADALAEIGGKLVLADPHPKLKPVFEALPSAESFPLASDIPEALAQIGISTAPELPFGHP